MPGTLPPVARELLDSLRQGDENAYHRLVVDLFPALVAEATSQLDDPVNASRIAEAVLLELWEERARFGSQEAAQAFLGEALHDAVVRDKRKRAALHRFEAREGGVARTAHAATVVSPEEAWQHIEAELHRPKVDSAKAHAEHAHHLAHERAAHIAAVAKPRSMTGPVLLGLGIAAAVFGALYWLNLEGADAKVTKALAGPDLRELKTATAQMGNVTLGDQTKAAMGAETRLTMAKGFGSAIRALKVEGTAAFTVAPNAELPFIVRVGAAQVTATGTVFAVRGYADEPEVTVRVTEGTVVVKVADAEKTLAAGQGMVITKDGATREAVPSDLDQAFGWQEKRFAITGHTLRDVLPQLKRWYGLDLKVLDDDLRDRLITMTAPLESSRDALAALEAGGQLKFTWEGEMQVLRDATPAAQGVRRK